MSSQHVCKNCGSSFAGKFCPECGEKVYTNDRSFKHLIEEVLHFFTHLEGTFFNSIKAMLSKPGKISEDFCNGVRKKYFKPLSFFLMLVILYLLFPVFEGLNMRLHYYKENRLFGAYATEQIEKVKEEKHFTNEQLEEVFLHKGEKTSKFLLFIIIPFLAAISFVVGFKKRKFYFDHFIFSAELISFFILFGFLILPLILILTQLIGFQVFHSDNSMVIFVYSILIIYVAISSKRFFHFTRFFSLIYALIFAASLWYFLEYGYKFILFSIAIHLI